jgi:diaminopimelate decarboxylase
VTLAELIPSLRSSCYARLEHRIWPDSAQASCAGGLAVGGVEIADIAHRFGTPLYVLDTEHIRARMLAYRAALPCAEIAYAGKALLTKALIRQTAEAGLSLDVCSGGEVALAIAAGFPPEQMLLHGNVKTDDELRLALDVGVGRIVLDSVDDIDRLGALARRQQRVMVRLTPAVDGQTHPALATGVEDQHFGVQSTRSKRSAGSTPIPT